MTVSVLLSNWELEQVIRDAELVGDLAAADEAEAVLADRRDEDDLEVWDDVDLDGQDY